MTDGQPWGALGEMARRTAAVLSARSKPIRLVRMRRARRTTRPLSIIACPFSMLTPPLFTTNAKASAKAALTAAPVGRPAARSAARCSRFRSRSYLRRSAMVCVIITSSSATMPRGLAWDKSRTCPRPQVDRGRRWKRPHRQCLASASRFTPSGSARSEAEPLSRSDGGPPSNQYPIHAAYLSRGAQRRPASRDAGQPSGIRERSARKALSATRRRARERAILISYLYSNPNFRKCGGSCAICRDSA